jgi:protein gp37
MWRKPLAWNAEAEKTGERHLVFTASLADVFEQWGGPIVNAKGQTLWMSLWHPDRPWAPRVGGVMSEEVKKVITLDDVRLRLFDMIMRTPHLTWLVLTKRIDQVIPTLERLARTCHDAKLCGWLTYWLNGAPPRNVWMGCTAEDQEWADKRVPELLKIPAEVRFVSYEPAIGPVDLDGWLGPQWVADADPGAPGYDAPGIDWVIVGGESGANARPFEIGWARNTIRQCKEAGVACFVKQMGARPIEWVEWGRGPIPSAALDSHLAMGGSEPDDEVHEWHLEDRAGADPSEWPSEFRVQQFPEAAKGV